MALAAWRPGAAVGVHRREARFVQIDQLDISTGRLVFEALNLYGRLLESVFVAAFFKECRVRFHTKSEPLSVATMVLTCTRGPPASRWRASKAAAVSGSAPAHCTRRSMCSDWSFLGAPQRGISDSAAMPLLRQWACVMRTVRTFRLIWAATSWAKTPESSSNSVCARSRSRQLLARLTMRCNWARLSSSSWRVFRAATVLPVLEWGGGSATGHLMGGFYGR